MGGAQQGVAGDHHVQDGLGQVGVEVRDGGREHDDVLGEGLVGVGQASVQVADTVVRLQRHRGSALGGTGFLLYFLFYPAR